MSLEKASRGNILSVRNVIQTGAARNGANVVRPMKVDDKRVPEKSEEKTNEWRTSGNRAWDREMGLFDEVEPGIKLLGM